MKKITCLVLSLLLALLTGCQGLDNWLFETEPPPISPSPSPTVLPSPPPGPPKNDLFGIPWSGQPALHPLTDNNRFHAQWLPLVYEGLFALDEQFQPQPVLCSGVVTQDNMAYTLTIRRDVTFHNGSPLTADDVVYTLNEVRFDKTQSPYAGRLESVTAVKASDDYTVEITLSAPEPRLPALLTFPILHKGSDALDIQPGTGPYQPVMDEDHPHLTRFDDWWQKKVLPTGRMELVPVTSSDRLIYAFESQALSIAVCNPSDVSDVSYSGDYESWAFDTPILEFVGFNTTRKPLDQPALRSAIAAAIDRAAIGREGGEERLTMPAVLPIPPVSPLYDRLLAERYVFDLSRTTALLQSLGYDDLDNDGVLERRSGRRSVPLMLALVVNIENRHHMSAARRLAETLTDSGVKTEVRALPFAAYRDALESGDFDLYYGQSVLSPAFSPLPFFDGGALGYGKYRDTQTLSLWRDACAAPQSSLAAKNFWTRFLEEAPIAPVLFERQTLLTQRGLVSDPRPVWGNPFAHVAEWTLP